MEQRDDASMTALMDGLVREDESSVLFLLENGAVVLHKYASETLIVGKCRPRENSITKNYSELV